MWRTGKKATCISSLLKRADLKTSGRWKRALSSVSPDTNPPPPPNNPPPPPPPPPPQYQQQYTAPRRPYNVEAKMRMKQYRREAANKQRQLAEEEEEKYFQPDQSKLYQKGDPGTVQAVVKEICCVGYFCQTPDGRMGYLPGRQLGCSGGVPLLSRLNPIGSEVTVVQLKMNDGGKDKLYVNREVEITPKLIL